MATLCNIIWHIPFLGFLFSLAYALWGLLLCCTIVLYPIGLGYLQLAKFLLSPFSSQMVDRADLDVLRGESHNVILEGYETIIRILYFPFGLVAAVFAIALIVTEFCSIIGIPFALVWAKSLGTIFNPINKVAVPEYVAEDIERLKRR